MGMGLETKDVNANAEKFFTRNYINDNGLRPYEWGKNHEFFNTLLGIRKIYAKIGVELKTKLHCWLNTNNSDVGSWLYYSKKDKTPSYLFVMNTARVKKENLEIENPLDMPFFKNELQNHRLGIRNIFSTDKSPKKIVAQIIYKNNPIKITNLAPGEGRIYKIIKNSHLLKRI